MLSELSPILIVVFLIAFIWLSGLTLFLVRALSHYNKLTKGVDKRSLQSTLESLLKNVQTGKHDVEDLKRQVAKLESNANFVMQKVSLLRFNPFADTGGEQSFIIGLLDKKNNGILITSLQGRSGTRWYVKQVKDGKGVKFDLSKEEEEAVKKAKSLNRDIFKYK